jgi:serine/threonine protein kinase
MIDCPYCQSSIPDNSAKCPVCGGEIEQDNSPSCTPLKTGSMIYSKYKVENVIGQGGFGITYLAYDEKLGRKVAIKEYFPDGIASRTCNKVTMPPTLENKKNMEGFTEEARAIAKLKNRGIVDVYDIIEENGTVYIVMEYISGVPMSSRLGKISEQDGLKYIRQVADAVKAIHNEGLLHQDIKPDNIIIKDSGDIKIIDFGSSSDFADDKTRTYEKILTPGYAPLEQYGEKGRRGEFTDVYAICATLYACIKGTPPPEATALAAGVPIDFAGIGDELKSIIERGLSVKIPDRIQNTDELVKLLDDYEEKRQAYKQLLNVGGRPDGRVSENISVSKHAPETPPEKINEIQAKSPIQPAVQNNLYGQPSLPHDSLNNVNSGNDKANIYSRQNFNKSNKKIALIAVIAGVIIFIASSAAAGYFYIYLPMKNKNTINTTNSSNTSNKSQGKSAGRLKAEKLEKRNKNKNKRNVNQLKHIKYTNNANNANNISNTANTGNTGSTSSVPALPKTNYVRNSNANSNNSSNSNNVRVAMYPPPVLHIAPPQTYSPAAPHTAIPENSVSAITPQMPDVFIGQGYEDFKIAGCFYCHRIYGKGNKNGSNLSNVGSLLSYVQIKNQILHPTSSMPPSPDMPPEELSQIANWLEGLK